MSDDTLTELELRKRELELKEREVIALETLARRSNPPTPLNSLQTIAKWWNKNTR